MPKAKSAAARVRKRSSEGRKYTFQELLTMPTLMLYPDNKLRIALTKRMFEIDLTDESISVRPTSISQDPAMRRMIAAGS